TTGSGIRDSGSVLPDSPGHLLSSRADRRRLPEHPEHSALYACASTGSSLYLISPPTIVITAFPRSSHPANGVLRDLDANTAGSTVHRRSRSISTSSPGASSSSRPPASPRMAAGLALRPR